MFLEGLSSESGIPQILTVLPVVYPSICHTSYPEGPNRDPVHFFFIFFHGRCQTPTSFTSFFALGRKVSILSAASPVLPLIVQRQDAPTNFIVLIELPDEYTPDLLGSPPDNKDLDSRVIPLYEDGSPDDGRPSTLGTLYATQQRETDMDLWDRAQRMSQCLSNCLLPELRDLTSHLSVLHPIRPPRPVIPVLPLFYSAITPSYNQAYPRQAASSSASSQSSALAFRCTYIVRKPAPEPIGACLKRIRLSTDIYKDANYLAHHITAFDIATHRLPRPQSDGNLRAFAAA
ncbi:hypothetical protein ACRALDRAFT_2019114 [Sodiomyces alcalophilus JCM 7366]|uniref:uncharacterized protein n=1 Tax=Sodiomyces alcalophilus JCM 7366 TaxID=591952 RepID=UPI0039B44CF2